MDAYDRDEMSELWAKWALLGDPFVPVPIPLIDLVGRVKTAINGALDGKLPLKKKAPKKTFVEETTAFYDPVADAKKILEKGTYQ